MKSTIKISLGENNKPVIRFNVSKDTEDLRDNLCSQFISELNYSSNFCFIEPEYSGDQSQSWVIKPIGEKDLYELQKKG